jgi:hypothetical protein
MRNPRAIPSAWTLALPVLLALGLFLEPVHAQYRRWGRFREANPEKAQQQEAMKQAILAGFEEDVFTFARLKFGDVETGYRYGNGREWDDDSPDADYNLTFRMYQVTSLKVRPGLNIIDITTRDLEKYPFVYMAAAGRLVLLDSEIADLRKYLLNGGFLMVDDFWGDEQWDHFHAQIKRVFPTREPVELHLDDKIFHTVYNFKKEPQMPSVGVYFRYGDSFEPGWPYYIKDHGPHYYAIYDDKHRMMAIICHNNHYGDGWEHEGDDKSYFERFSEAQAYPMFINILFYAMSH